MAVALIVVLVVGSLMGIGLFTLHMIHAIKEARRVNKIVRCKY